MQSLKHSKRSIAAVVFGIGLAAPVFGITLTPNQLGTPDDGMICRGGYTGSLAGSAFKCAKTQRVTVTLECLRPNFPNYVRRATALPNSDGRDICVRNDVQVTSNGPLTGLTEGTQYVFAAVNPDVVTQKVSEADSAEAQALGLTTNDVETKAGTTTVRVDPGSAIRDDAAVQLTHYTFAIKTGGINAAQR